jgi:hypothetical protein
MEWGLAWGLLAVFLFALVVSYAIIRETRAQRHWRGLVKAGDVDAIRTIVDSEVGRWRTERTPKGVLPNVWHGVQTAELVEVGSDHLRVRASTEAQYAVAGRRREEVSSALREAMKLTVKLAEMLLYDISNVELGRVQIDIYTTFRGRSGLANQRCILSTVVRRSEAGGVEWDETPPEEIVAHFGGRYRADSQGRAQPIDPDDEAVEAEPPGQEAPVR